MTVDKFGRKPLQIIGALGMAIGMFSLGTAFYTQAPGIVALLSMLFYVAAFAMSTGSSMLGTAVGNLPECHSW